MPFVFIIIAIGAVIGIIALLVLIIKNAITLDFIKKRFKKCNVVVDGKKGTGKDLFFQWIIGKRKKEDYYGNISYGYKYHHVSVKDLSVEPNTYLQFINEQVHPIERKFKEGCDYYLSDGGIFLPSYMDSTLYKLFPSFPIFYALSRHLYDANIHVNVQNFNRLWKAIREQADYFIHVKKTIKIFGILITTFTAYDKYESATRYLEPINARILNKYSKAEVDIYNAENGDIRKGFIIQRCKSIKYNTRAFEKVVLKGKRLKRCIKL